MFSFQIFDQIRQQSSWASCEFNTRRATRVKTSTRLNSTVASRRRRRYNCLAASDMLTWVVWLCVNIKSSSSEEESSEEESDEEDEKTAKGKVTSNNICHITLLFSYWLFFNMYSYCFNGDFILSSKTWLNNLIIMNKYNRQLHWVLSSSPLPGY